LGIDVRCVVVAVIGGCRLSVRLWLGEDTRCAIVVFACVVVAVGKTANDGVVFVVCSFGLFLVIMVTVIMCKCGEGTGCVKQLSQLCGQVIHG